MDSFSSVFVTGGAGYVGSTLINDLANCGYNVRTLDSKIFCSDKNDNFLKNSSIEFIHGDIRNSDLLASCLEGIDYVIHLAAITGPLCDKAQKATIQTNEVATKELVNLCKKKKIKRFFFASTCSNYGSNLKIVNEQTPLQPVSLYSETKVNSESLVLNSKSINFEPCVLRFSTIFGISPEMRFDLLLQELILNAIVYKKILIFGPDFWRPLIHVKDASNACIRCIKSSSDLISGEIYNVGASEQNFTKLELAQIVQEYFPNIEIEIQESRKDPRNYKVSFDKIRETFDFKIKNTIRDGISEMVDGINNGTLNYTKSDYSSRVKLVEKIPVF